MSSQVPLPIGDRVRASLEASAAEIRAELRAIAKRTKQGAVLARAANMDAGDLSKALAGERDELGRLERKLDVSVLPAFFFADEEDGRLVRLFCRQNSGLFVPTRELTADQRLENVLRECRRSGSAGAAILRDAGEES